MWWVKEKVLGRVCGGAVLVIWVERSSCPERQL